jgi:hypothetical protein
VLYRFSNDSPASRIEEVIDFTLGPRMWISDEAYPDLSEWGQKLHEDLKVSSKRAFVAFDADRVIGTIIYREHEETSNTLELRRITIHRSHEGRYVSDFLLRNVEFIAQSEFGADNVVVDSKTSAFGMIHFLLRSGYKITDKLDLYGLGGGEDFIYRKKLMLPRHEPNM